ncbi:MAG: hypothetical protein C4309_12435 [Chloroflexota bacterium]
MEPLTVEVIAYAPTAFYHCMHCEVVWKEVGMGDPVHREQMRNALPDDLREDYRALSAWAQQLANRACGRVAIKVVDAASVEGFIKSLRYRVRRYPTVIIPGAPPYITTDFALADQEIARRLEASPMMAGAKQR